MVDGLEQTLWTTERPDAAKGEESRCGGRWTRQAVGGGESRRS